MNKSAVLKILILFVFYKSASTSPQKQPSVPFSIIALAEAVQPHIEFFDMYKKIYENSTMKYSLENNAISSAICFEDSKSDHRKCTLSFYDIGQNLTHKICNSSIGLIMHAKREDSELMTVDSNSAILHHEWTILKNKKVTHKGLHVDLRTYITSDKCSEVFTNIYLPKMKWESTNKPIIATYKNHIEIFYEHSNTQAQIYQTKYDKEVKKKIKNPVKEIKYENGLISIHDIDQLKPIVRSNSDKIGYINFSKKQMVVTSYLKVDKFYAKEIDHLDLKNNELDNAEEMQVAESDSNSIIALTSIAKKKILLLVVNEDLKFKQKSPIDLMPKATRIRIYYSNLNESFYLLQSECQSKNRICRILSKKIYNDANPIINSEVVVKLDTADCDLTDFNVLKPSDYLAYVCKKNFSYGSQKNIEYYLLKATGLSENSVQNTYLVNLNYLESTEIWENHVNEYSKLLDIKKYNEAIIYQQDKKSDRFNDQLEIEYNQLNNSKSLVNETTVSDTVVTNNKKIKISSTVHPILRNIATSGGKQNNFPTSNYIQNNYFIIGNNSLYIN